MPRACLPRKAPINQLPEAARYALILYNLPQPAHRPLPYSTMSYLGSLQSVLTTTTSKYNTLRRQLLPSEDDGDTEDDSHVARVLRAYYIEKGRPFPPWLPADPKAPQAAPAQVVTSSGRQQQAQPAMRAGGLSDLWDNGQQQTQPQQPQSLRAGRGRGMAQAQQAPTRTSIVDSLEPAPQARLLPSQKQGSYQGSLSQQSMRPPAEPSPPSSSGGGTTAQERLKARLWGSGRSSSPTPSQASASRISPQQSPGYNTGSVVSQNPYQQAPPPASGNPYGSSNPYADQGGASGGSRGGYFSGPQGQKVGLPNGPRPHR